MQRKMMLRQVMRRAARARGAARAEAVRYAQYMRAMEATRGVMRQAARVVAHARMP